MCGRFTLRARLNRVLAEFAVELQLAAAEDLPWEPRFNLAPTQSLLAIRATDVSAQVCRLRWGLIPSWAKDAKIGSSLINARAETIAEKPAFRAAFKRRRCLILADGFYEWQKVTSKQKTPHYFTVRGGELFAFAGLWEQWREPTGATLETATIITTTPNSLLQPFHDRMPVILPPVAYRTWLDSNTDPASLHSLLLPFAAEEMSSRVVSNYVNSATHEGPDCLA